MCPPSNDSAPVPSADFTSEGCFLSAQDYAWTSVADAELARRLTQLG